MSKILADQMLKSLISKEECRGCDEMHYEILEDGAIPFCKKRWFGEKCVREDGEKE